MANDYLQQLPPELIALLAQGGSGLPVVGPDGNLYYGVTNQGGSNSDMGTLQSIYAASPQIAGSNTDNIGAALPTYDPSGKLTGSRPYEPDSANITLGDVLRGAAFVGGSALGMNALFGGLGGLGGAGAGAAGSDALATGGFLGEAPYTLTGGGALDFGGAAAGAGGGGGGGSLVGDYGAASSAGMAAPAAAGGGGSGLFGTGLTGSQLLGGASTLLGGATGAQGQQKTQTETKDIPEWLKPYVNKMLGYSGGLLDKQMAPGYLQGYDDMRRVGQGLLNQPVAGNGTSLFPSLYPRK